MGSPRVGLDPTGVDLSGLEEKKNMYLASQPELAALLSSPFSSSSLQAASIQCASQIVSHFGSRYKSALALRLLASLKLGNGSLPSQQLLGLGKHRPRSLLGLDNLTKSIGSGSDKTSSQSCAGDHIIGAQVRRATTVSKSCPSCGELTSLWLADCKVGIE